MLNLSWWRLACWAMMQQPSHLSIVEQVFAQTDDAARAVRANKEIAHVDKR